jgi:hypothetical protein
MRRCEWGRGFAPGLSDAEVIDPVDFALLIDGEMR